MSDSVLTPRFLASRRGRVFVLMRRPRAGAGRAVLIIPPFAEEMNKSRKMFTDLAQALATHGLATVIPDFYGTGDSEGEFRDADVECWLEDLTRATSWSEQEGWPISGLLCMRTGCLLGARLVGDVVRSSSSVFWQPVVDGERFLTQFLRLRLAASMLEGSGAGKESAAALRERLRAGETLEVAGYELSGTLADQLSRLKLTPESMGRFGELRWFEVVRSADAVLPGAAANFVAAANEKSGATVKAETVVGEPFWSSTEIVRLPELVARTADAFARLQ